MQTSPTSHTWGKFRLGQSLPSMNLDTHSYLFCIVQSQLMQLRFRIFPDRLRLASEFVVLVPQVRQMFLEFVDLLWSQFLAFVSEELFSSMDGI